MQISVRYIPGEPSFDSLEVIKLCCDRSIDINSRIYGQTQIGRNEELLFAKILSFESEPTADSTVMLELRLGENALSAQVRFDGSSSLILNGMDENDKLSAYIISGEDLQGEYWGAVIMLPMALLLGHFSLSENALPASVYGNIIRREPAVSSAAPLSESAEITIMPKS